MQRWASCCVATLVIAATPAAAGEHPPHAITVLGYGSASAAPDGFVVSVELSATRDTVEDAREQVAQAAGALLAAAEDFDLVRDRSFTTSLRLSPDRAWNAEQHKHEFLGYEAAQSLRFQLADLKQAEGLTLAVLRTGVTSVSTSFISSARDRLRRDARAAALRDARRTADEMAEVLGMSVGLPIDVREVEPGYGGGQSIFGGGQGSWQEDELSLAEPERLHWLPPTLVAVESTVQIRFELLPR